MADPTDGRWEAIDAFYRDLIEEHGWRLGPLRQFASGLGSGAYGRALFPSTSHDALGLSTVAGSDDRMKRPMVHVHYDPHRGRFLVRYQGPDLWPDRYEWTGSPESPEVLARILDWLGVPRRPGPDLGEMPPPDSTLTPSRHPRARHARRIAPHAPGELPAL